MEYTLEIGMTKHIHFDPCVMHNSPLLYWTGCAGILGLCVTITHPLPPHFDQQGS